MHSMITSISLECVAGQLTIVINGSVQGQILLNSSEGLDGSEDFVSDGSGTITLPNNYISGKCEVFLRGVLLRKSDFSESSTNELTLIPPTEVGDFIHVNYKY